MTIRIKIILLLACLIVNLSSILYAGDAGPKAVFTESEHDFGKAFVGDTASHIFLLKNAGDKELFIENLEITGPYTTVMLKKNLPPGQEMRITIAIDTDKLAGSVNSSAILHTNDPSHPQIKFKMYGLVVPVIDVLPTSSMYFSLYKGESKEKSVNIINNLDQDLKITGMDYQSERFQAHLETVKEGKEYKLTTKVNPQALPGRTMEKVILSTNIEKRSQLTIGVNILIKNDVYNFPDKIDFGKIIPNDVKNNPKLLSLLPQTCLVKRRPGKKGDFQIKIEHNIPFLKIKKERGDKDTYKLDVTPDLGKMKPGKIDTFIKVKTNDKEVPELRIPVVGEII